MGRMSLMGKIIAAMCGEITPFGDFLDKNA
jgi:hypothetical protein